MGHVIDYEAEYLSALDRAQAAEAKLSKVRDLTRAWTKGEPASATVDNIQRVLVDLPLVDEPTWAYNH